MVLSCACTRRSITAPPSMSSKNASAAVPAMAESFTRKVSRMSARSLDGDDLDALHVSRRRDVPNRAGVQEHVLDDVVFAGELGRRQIAPREDPLLPIALHGRDRAVQHVLGEALA